MRQFRLHVLIFLGAILILLLFWTLLPAAFQAKPKSDTIEYYEPVARNILAGQGITLQGAPATFYPPIYSLILAQIFKASHLTGLSENTLLSALILLCMAAASLFIFIMARSIWGTVPALFSWALWVTYPCNVWMTKQCSSEIPFLPVFYGCFCLFVYMLFHNKGNFLLYFLCGLLAGLAMLIRPLAIGVGGVLALLVLIFHNAKPGRRFALAGALLLGNLLALAPWQAWIYSHTGKLTFLATGGASSVRDGLTFAVNPKNYRLRTPVSKDVQALMQELLARQQKLDSLYAIAVKLLQEAKIRPFPLAKLLFLKMARSWYGTDSGHYEIPILLVQMVYMGLALGSGRLAIKLGGIAKGQALCVWLMILYFWMATTSGLSIVRYMVPAFALSFIFLPTLWGQEAQPRYAKD